MKFKSKKDKNIIGILLVLPAVGTILSSILLKINLASSLILLFLCYILSCFIIIAIISTKYILEEDRLIISSMGIKKCILYDDIVQVNEQYKFLTIEAPSIPQVCIITNNKSIVKISPANREQFISLLNKKRNAIVPRTILNSWGRHPGILRCRERKASE